MAKRFRLILDRSSNQHAILFDDNEIVVSPNNPHLFKPSRQEFAIESLHDRWEAFNFGGGQFGINKNGLRVVDGHQRYGKPAKYGYTRVLPTVALTLHGISAVHEDIARNNHSFACPHQYGVRIVEPTQDRLCIMQYTKDHNVMGIIKESLPFGIDPFELFAIGIILRTGVLNFSD